MTRTADELAAFHKWVDGPSKGLRTPEAAWLERARQSQNPGYMPTLDEAIRFIRSNPQTTMETLARVQITELHPEQRRRKL